MTRARRRPSVLALVVLTVTWALLWDRLTLFVLLTGVLHGIISPLAAGQIAVTTVSTYRTDWILVPSEQTAQAVNVWRYHGYAVRVDEPGSRNTPDVDGAEELA